MTLIEIIAGIEDLWAEETKKAIKLAMQEREVFDTGELENSISWSRSEGADTQITFGMKEYGKFQDRGVNPEGLALYQTPYYFRGNWKGTALAITPWAQARGLNEWAVARTLQFYTGIKPKQFFNRVIGQESLKLPEQIGQAIIDFQTAQIQNYNKQNGNNN